MNYLRNTALCFAFSAVACALTSCQDDPAKQGGTYTAARHMSVGSNIPQRSNVENTSSVDREPTESSSISLNNGAAGGSSPGQR